MKFKQVLAVITTTAIAMFTIQTPLTNVIYAEDTDSNVTILYTNDAHNAFEKNTEEGVIGYAAIANYKKQLEADGSEVILIDAGDAIQGGVIGTLSKGEYIQQIMDKTGYALAVPGNHEFDFGMDTFLALAEKAEYDYICCNFIDLRTGESVFDSYRIIDYNGTKIAYIGIATPETYTKSTPTYFMDEDGDYIYGFCNGDNGNELYEKIQETIDAAMADGADCVVAIGHTGIDLESSPWTTEEIIANTTGINAYVDGHSHSVIPHDNYKNKDGEDVLVTSTGTKLEYLGVMEITSNNSITSNLISDIPEEDSEVLEFINGIKSQFEELQNKVVASTEIDLIVNDPSDSETRIIRSQETNLGDLCADAYLAATGADIAFANGGGIRTDIKKGNITYGNIISVHPYENKLCMIEVTGQQVLDALEFGSSSVGEGESGGFLHVAGLTYQINTAIKSSVVTDENGMFVKVDGIYRVENVVIGDEALDLNKTYTLASHNYMLKSAGDGYSMFSDSTILLDETIIDNQALINYIVDELGGNIKADSKYADPYGTGRITIVNIVNNPTTGNSVAGQTAIVIVSLVSLGAMVASLRKRS